VLLAVVLPFCPTVLDGGQHRSPRVALMNIPGCGDNSYDRWERTANALVENVFEVAGFELVSLSRVPYMSHGDNRCGLYTLDDAIFVLRPVKQEGQAERSTEASSSSMGLSRIALILVLLLLLAAWMWS
jgi:hypothetical protein